MGKKIRVFILCIVLMASTILLSACGGSGSGSSTGSGGSSGNIGSAISNTISNIGGGSKDTVQDDASLPLRDTTPKVLENTAPGTKTATGNGAVIDYSNISDGYIMAKYDGSNPKIKLQITRDGDSTYTYDVAPNQDYAGFPLSAGDGSYTVAMFLNIEGDSYSQACAATFQVTMTDQFSPFLRPNQYSNFTSSTNAVAKAAELAQGSRSDLKVVENCFVFIIGNVTYDYDLANNVQSGYIPDVDRTLSTGKGICFDYASLMACMLRSQSIPCKLVVGYAGTAYHAWISVYVDGVGWVANMIQFNGDTWTLMDPTFAANGDKSDPNLVGDGTTYNPVYYY